MNEVKEGVRGRREINGDFNSTVVERGGEGMVELRVYLRYVGR